MQTLSIALLRATYKMREEAEDKRGGACGGAIKKEDKGVFL